MKQRLLCIILTLFLLFAVSAFGQQAVGDEKQTNTIIVVPLIPAYEKSCENGHCRMVINSYKEDLIIDEDPSYPSELESFDGRNLVIRHETTETEDVPLKLIDSEGKTASEYLIEDKAFSVTYDLYDYNISDFNIKWGKNSTHIRLNKTDSGILEDATFAEGTAYTGTETMMYIRHINGSTGKVAIMKINLASLPDNASIISAKIVFKQLSGNTGMKLHMWYSDNQTWLEEDIDDLCGAGLYCNGLNGFFDYKITQFNSAATMTINNSNFTNKLNTTFIAGIRNFTLAFNTSSTTGHFELPSKEYATASYATQLYIVYDEIAGSTPPSGGSSHGTQFTYNQYSFILNNQTGGLINVTANGETTPIISRYARNWFYDNTTLYTISNVDYAMMIDTDGYGVLQVNSTLSYGGNDYGVAVENWRLFNNSVRFYLADSTVYAIYRDTPLWGANASFIANGATKCYYNPSTGVPVSQALTSSGTVYHNISIDSGSGTSTETAKNFIRGINTSNGFFYIATAHMCENMADNGQNPGCSYSWAHADNLDLTETQDELHHDYNISSPLKTMYCKDNGASSKLYYEVKYTEAEAHGYRHILRKQNIPARLLTVAKDHFRMHFAIGIGGKSESIVTGMNTFETESTYLSGEVSFLGMRITDGMGNVQTGVISGAQYASNPTQALLDDDMEPSEDVGKEHLLADAFRFTDAINYGRGWVIYPPWPVPSYGGAESKYGNPFERYYSFQVYDSSWLASYLGTKEEMIWRYDNYTTVLQLNNNTFYGTRRNWTALNTGTQLILNKTLTEMNPYLGGSRSRSANGDFKLSFTGGYNWGADTWLVHGIYVIDEDNHSVILSDDFSSNTLASYTVADPGVNGNITYDAANKALRVSVTDGTLISFQPAADPDYGDAIYIFDVEYTTNPRLASASTDMGGNMLIHTRYDGTDTDYFRLYVHPDQTDTSTPSMTGSRKGDWTIFDITLGVLSDNWGRYVGNASAYFVRWSAALPTENAGTGVQILNIQNYYSVIDSDFVQINKLLGQNAKASQRVDTLHKMVKGFNYLISTDTGWVRPDGFLHYSRTYINSTDGKDDGYEGNTFDQLNKIQRGIGNYSLEIPVLNGMAWYYRNCRFNQSEGPAQYGGWNNPTTYQKVAMVSFISKLSQYRFPCRGSYTKTIDESNKANTFFLSEFSNDIGTVCSSKADTFGGRTTIFYENNSIKTNWTDALNVYEHNPKIQLRWGTQENGKVYDAYQLENSSNVVISWMPIVNETKTIDYTKDEAYPICTFTGNTRYDRTKFRLSNTVDSPNENSTIGILDIMVPAYDPANVTIPIVNAKSSTDYTIYVGGLAAAGITTDASGSGSNSVMVNTGELIELKKETYTAPIPVSAGSQLVYTNITNNTIINYSRLNGYIGARFVSYNLSIAWLTLLVDGVFSTWKNANNMTLVGFSALNITPGLRTIVISTDYNQTRQYVLNIRNTTGGNTSATDDEFTLDFPTTANSAIWGLLLVAIAVIVFMVVIPVIYGAANGLAISDNILQPLLTIAVIILIAFIMLALASRVIG